MVLLFEAMELVGLNIDIYTFILIIHIVGDLKNESNMFLLDCVLALYFPRIKNTLKMIKELQYFYELIFECANNQHLMHIDEKRAKFVIYLILGTSHNDSCNMPVIAVDDVSPIYFYFYIHLPITLFVTNKILLFNYSRQ